MRLLKQKGFTLIELMVVIVIIGILAALAIPKMLGVSGKAKASEAPTAVANFETLQSAYMQETGVLGKGANIGYVQSTSKWWDNAAPLANTTDGLITMKTLLAVGDCPAAKNILSSQYALTDTYVHDKTLSGVTACQAYFPNF